MAQGLLRSRALVAALVVGAAVAGMWARPRLAAIAARWNAPPGPAQPTSPVLWSAKVDQFRALASAGSHGDAAIVYLGDSITDWVNLDEFLGGSVRILNRGISGDTASGVARRAADSVPAGTRAVFLMVGYNDLTQGESAGDTAARIVDVAAGLRSSGRASAVVVETIPPPGNDVADRVAALNEALQARAANLPGVSVLDLTASFLRDGRRDPALFAGEVHLSAAGALKRLRAELAHLARIDPETASRMRIAGDE